MTARFDDPEQPVFGSFDPRAEVEITERNLPHWFQADAALFVTFRAADSLPAEVVDRWERELTAWLAARDLPTKLAKTTVRAPSPQLTTLRDQMSSAETREFKRLTDRLFHQSLDECHGACFLRRPELAEIVGDALLFQNGNKYDLDRFVVMPNHVHVIVQFREGESLQSVRQSWLRFTARQINAATGGSGRFWQPEPFDHIIRSTEQFEYLQRYVADNPKRANLRPGEYLFWKRESV